MHQRKRSMCRKSKHKVSLSAYQCLPLLYHTLAVSSLVTATALCNWLGFGKHVRAREGYNAIRRMCRISTRQPY